MINRMRVAAFLSLAVIAWATLLWARGLPFSWAYFWPFGLVAGFLSFILMLWERFLWHLPVFYGWLVRCPDLRGTWRAELDSSWIDFATETHAPTIRCYVAITQTATKLQLRLMTGESESWVLASGIRVSEKGPGYQVTGVYLNQPDSQLRGARSEMHFGAFVLDTHGSAQRPSSMKGEYWTDRGTKGSLHLTSHVGAILTSFDEADARLG